jgi:voltage-gated potassium channel
MIMGYGIIAVPTGIVTAEMTKSNKIDTNTQECPHCLTTDHKENAIHCHQCGKKINHVN